MESTIQGRALYQQVESEMERESLDARRVRHLKAQIVQLERQVVLMTATLGGYQEKFIMAEGALSKCNDFIQAQVRSAQVSEQKSSSIKFPRQDLEAVIRENTSIIDSMAAHQAPDNPINSEIYGYYHQTRFLLKKTHPTLGEISSGKLSHINLGQVSKLEDRLARLHGELFGFSLRLHCDGLREQADTLVNTIDSVCEDLMTLSLLIPSQQWKKLHSLPEVTVENIMAELPKLTTSRQKAVRNLLSAVVKITEHRYRLQQYKVDQLEKELSSQTSHKLSQRTKTEQLLDDLLKQHKLFYVNLGETLITPLKETMEEFQRLSLLPTDENLKRFLERFKQSSPQMQMVCDSVQEHLTVYSKLSLDEYKTLLKKGIRVERKKPLWDGVTDEQREIQREIDELSREIEGRMSLQLEKHKNDAHVSSLSNLGAPVIHYGSGVMPTKDSLVSTSKALLSDREIGSSSEVQMNGSYDQVRKTQNAVVVHDRPPRPTKKTNPSSFQPSWDSSVDTPDTTKPLKLSPRKAVGLKARPPWNCSIGDTAETENADNPLTILDSKTAPISKLEHKQDGPDWLKELQEDLSQSSRLNTEKERPNSRRTRRKVDGSFQS